MNVKESDVDRMWKKLGFEIDSSRADVKANLRVNGRLILRTYRSHGRGKMSGNIPHKIRSQMRLNLGEFEDAIACPLKADAYLEILRSKGVLE